MKRRCVVFLYDYPFRAGEPFMETEIWYLSKTFEEVIVFPILVNKKESQTRPLPKNVKAVPLQIRRCRFINILKGFFSLPRRIQRSRKNFKAFLADTYSKGRQVAAYKAALAYLKSVHFDANDTVVYSYWLTCAMSAVLLRDYFLEHGCVNASAVSRGHRYDIYAERNSVNHVPLQECALNQLDYVAVCSADGRKYLQNKYPSLSLKIGLSRLGTMDHGLASWDPAAKKTLLTCSSLMPVKRVSLFAQAFSLLSKSMPDLRWICIGDGPEREAVEQALRKGGVEDRVIMKGRLPNTEVYRLYAEESVDYFVNVSSSEGVPVSIMEAESFGIPIMATDVGGSGEIVDNANGRLLPSELTPESLAQALLEELTLSDEKRKEKRLASRRVWEKMASSENYAEWAAFLSR